MNASASQRPSTLGWTDSGESPARCASSKGRAADGRARGHEACLSASDWLPDHGAGALGSWAASWPRGEGAPADPKGCGQAAPLPRGPSNQTTPPSSRRGGAVLPDPRKRKAGAE